MRITCIVLICYFLLACSSTKVHLYKRYLSAQETEIIVEKLAGNGFEVITNTLIFPDEMWSSNIVSY